MHILINLIVNVLCGLLKWVSERFWHNAQRFIMPLLIVFLISFNSHIWWLGLPSLIMIAGLLQGYGEKSLLYKLLGDAGAQGMWMFLVCFLAGIFPASTNHLSLFFFIPWVIVAGIIGATCRAGNNNILAPLRGIIIGLIVWFIH